MILGADSEAKAPPPKKSRRHPTHALSDEFIHHPKAGMRGMIPQHQVVIRATMKRLLNQYVESDVKQYIDKFYDQGFAEKKGYPLSFCSKSLQEQLIEGKRLPANEVERWMQHGFERGDIDLPWPCEDDAAVRRAILLNPMDAQKVVDEFSI